MNRVVSGGRALVLVAAVGYVLTYAVLVFLRVQYPFELEWLEGVAVDHVRTILAGQPLYARPSLTFTPLIYAPGYFYLGAALSRVMGVGFLPLRLISILSSAGLLALTVLLVRRETHEWWAGWLAAGVFAATFGLTGGWLDLARTDSLFLLFTMAAVWVLRWHSSTAAMMTAGLLISLAFLTKQTGLIVAIPLCAWTALRGWRAFLSFTGTVVVLIVGTTLVFNRVFDGWYLYYLFDVPRQHPLVREEIIGFWRYDLLGRLPVAFAVSCLYLTWWFLRGDRLVACFYAFVAAGCVGGAWISRVHSGGFINVVLPAYLIVSVVFAIAISHTIRLTADWLTPGRHGLFASGLYGLCLFQFVGVSYAPREFVPTAEDVAAGRLLLERITESPGRVFVPDHGYLPALAGKQTNAHTAVIADVIRGGVTDVEKEFAEELRASLRTHAFDSVFLLEPSAPLREWLPIEEY